MDRKIQAVIVDEEGTAREQVTELLRGEPDFGIVGICSNGREAIALLNRVSVDVVFLNVHLSDIDGFEVLTSLGRQVLPLVVLITVHDRYAVRAFDMGVLDYLIRPFDSLRFAVTLARVRKESCWKALGQVARVETNAATFVAPVPHATDQLRRVMIKDRERTYFIPASEIDWIESVGNYVQIHVANGVHLMRSSLKHLVARLDPGQFARIQRRAIVNLDRVRGIEPAAGRDHIAILEDGTRLTLSHRYRRRLELAWRVTPGRPDPFMLREKPVRPKNTRRIPKRPP
jgi:Response regulator of the LytR/AlgR family